VKADSNSTTDNTNICDKSIDSDCDGLTNAEEKLYGTDPNNPDTDGDGYSDGVEVKSGYDPLKPAPGDKIATGENTSAVSNQANAADANTPTLTDNYLQDFSSFVSSKDGQSVSTADINTFADEQVAKNIGDPVTLDTLPDVDQSQIKILNQDYPSLSATDKKKQEAKDAANYLAQMTYLLMSNSPVQLSTTADFTTLQNDFFSHLADLSSSTSDSEYFSDLGNRLEVVVNQAMDIQVPETMVDLHVKFLRIAKGILTLRDLPFDANDPMGKTVFLTKVQAYLNLVSDFFQNDFKNYFEQFNTN